MQNTKQRILCVVAEDDRSTLLSTFGQSIYELKIAKTIAEALRFAKSERFDLYLFAKILPNGTDIDLCLQIREFDPHTPILLLTDSDEEDIWKRAKRAGAQGYMVRPGSTDDLANVVSRLMNQPKETTEA
jgi:DNA-binding NarL/FixJ family response regulator